MCMSFYGPMKKGIFIVIFEIKASDENKNNHLETLKPFVLDFSFYDFDY